MKFNEIHLFLHFLSYINFNITPDNLEHFIELINERQQDKKLLKILIKQLERLEKINKIDNVVE